MDYAARLNSEFDRLEVSLDFDPIKGFAAGESIEGEIWVFGEHGGNLIRNPDAAVIQLEALRPTSDEGIYEGVWQALG